MKPNEKIENKELPTNEAGEPCDALHETDAENVTGGLIALLRPLN